MSIVCRQQFLVHTYVVVLSVLLTGIIGEATSSRVLNCGYIIQEADVEVRPELLPSGLLVTEFKCGSCNIISLKMPGSCLHLQVIIAVQVVCCVLISLF